MKLVLDNFMTQDTSEAGVWYQPHDAAGRLLGIEVLVFGDDSSVVKRSRDEMLRKQTKLSKEERDSIDASAFLREIDSSRVGGIRIVGKSEADSVIEVGGRVITKSSDDIKYFFLKSPASEDDIRNYSQARANFLPKEKTSSKEPSDASSSSTTHTQSEQETNVEQ